ncbi:MAG TPA: dockerin type I domain-containing protein, partial [Pirellulales bacterium]
NSLAVNYGTGSLFTSGYDGIVNSLDLNAVATNFGPTPSTPAFLAPNNTVSFITSGDVNEDGIVTPLDFNAIASNFGKHTSSWNEGDVNHDGKVNVKDADIVADHFGQFNAFLVSLNNSSHISS